jgi:hypothetical protein
MWAEPSILKPSTWRRVIGVGSYSSVCAVVPLAYLGLGYTDMVWAIALVKILRHAALLLPGFAAGLVSLL